ncbi:MAG: GPR endopeptidase, partial [Clostridia bacterium]|nr:GPR endopeptidase [Clostridia bacterium]
NKYTFGKLLVEEVIVSDQNGETLSGKPKGTYTTLNTGKLWLDDRAAFQEKLFDFSSFLSKKLSFSHKDSPSVLIAGLGNESITADAIGPIAIKNLIVTRHIRKERPLIFEDLGLFDVCAITPGVLGQTGIESADIIKSVVEKIKPSLLIVIDALASRDLSRLVTTIQLCDSGIRPGSGIGNKRPGLLPEEFNIPILSIGVPTVVDAATLAADAIQTFSAKETDSDEIRKTWNESGLNFFVTPKETDQIIKVMGSFIAYGLNLALNKELSYEDMLSLAGG